jgi:hypothetical protein
MRTINWDAPLSEEDKGWALQRDMHEQVEANEKRFAKASEGDDGKTDAEGGPTPDDYDKWKVEELRTEAESRDPAVDLTGVTLKADIIAKLREWDAEYPDA